MSAVATITNIRLNLGRYGLSTLIVLGNIGNILTISIFIRTLKKQLNSCTLYLLSAALTNWMLINTSLISTVYGVDHTDPQHGSIVLCKLRWYGGHILLMLSRSFLISACVDRWALTCPNAKFRRICQPKFARNVIIILMLIWPIIAVHMAIYVNNYSGRCGTPSYYTFPFTIYLFVFIGILPPILMIIFALLTKYNLKKIRSRIASDNDQSRFRLQQSDRNLIKMLTGEVLVYIITTVVYPMNTLYGFVTSPIAQQKSEMRLAVETLIAYIVSPFLNYIYCVAQFYVYMACSGKFRNDFIRLIRCRPVVEK